MKTVLSLDLDITMSPYVGIYNHFINGDNRSASWSDIKFTYEVSDFQINKDYVNLLKEIIQQYQQQVDKVYVCDNHGMILKVIEDNNFAYEDLEIYNVDYHHDINYHISRNKIPPEDVEEALRRGAVADWAGYCIYHGSKYHWYRGIGSDLQKKFFMGESIVRLPRGFTADLFAKETFPMDKQVDMLFITTSLPWVPEVYTKDIEEIIATVDPKKLTVVEGDMNIITGPMKAKPKARLPYEA